jgi:hypothetical protein
MKKYLTAVFLIFLGLIIWWSRAPKLAQSATVGPQLIITQIKITSSNGQFITLYNNTNNAIDLSTIQLQYFNNFDLLKATSGKLISLTGKVPAHGYVVIDDGPIQACYQMTVNSVSLGLSSTAGFIQVSHFLGTTSPQVISTLDDYVGWTKTAAAGAQTLPASSNAFLQRKAPDSSSNYANIAIAGSGSWTAVNQPDGSAACDASAASVASGTSLLGTGSGAIPYTLIAVSATLTSIPSDDAGLAAPRISEVLPNPAAPQTDADDEFVELYNSNDQPFDLSGFIIQVGTTTTHKYTFPAGTSLQPHDFSAFYSSDTGLSLSNSDGQVMLLDPGGNVLNKTDEYTTAKDGYAWVSADGLWQWTVSPTPGAVNIITAPPPAKSSKSSTAGSSKSVKGARTTAGTTFSPGGGPPSGTPAATKMHPLVLAGVGAAALLYGLYEYRHDLANQLYRLQRYRAARRVAG